MRRTRHLHKPHKPKHAVKFRRHNGDSGKGIDKICRVIDYIFSCYGIEIKHIPIIDIIYLYDLQSHLYKNNDKNPKKKEVYIEKINEVFKLPEVIQKYNEHTKKEDNKEQNSKERKQILEEEREKEREKDEQIRINENHIAANRNSWTPEAGAMLMMDLILKHNIYPAKKYTITKMKKILNKYIQLFGFDEKTEQIDNIIKQRKNPKNTNKLNNNEEGKKWRLNNLWKGRGTKAPNREADTKKAQSIFELEQWEKKVKREADTKKAQSTLNYEQWVKKVKREADTKKALSSLNNTNPEEQVYGLEKQVNGLEEQLKINEGKEPKKEGQSWWNWLVGDPDPNKHNQQQHIQSTSSDIPHHIQLLSNQKRKLDMLIDMAVRELQNCRRSADQRSRGGRIEGPKEIQHLHNAVIVLQQAETMGQEYERVLDHVLNNITQRNNDLRQALRNPPSDEMIDAAANELENIYKNMWQSGSGKRGKPFILGQYENYDSASKLNSELREVINRL